MLTQSNLEIGCSTHPQENFTAFMAKLVRHLTSNEEIVSSNLAEGILFCWCGESNIALVALLNFVSFLFLTQPPMLIVVFFASDFSLHHLRRFLFEKKKKRPENSG